jgi:acetyltransferase-like isoleucine patch superfamily enzyme
VRQHEALTALGFDVRRAARMEDIPANAYPCLALTDDLYFNVSALREFLGAARRAAGSSQCATRNDTVFARTFNPLHEDQAEGRNRFPLYYLKAPGARVDELVIDIGEYPFPIYIPPHMRGPMDIAFPACLRPLMRITHAVELLFANLACIHVRVAEVFASPRRRLSLALRAMSTNPARVLARMNRIGPGCQIHPTAWLEGAELGANVQIGAYAVVRMSRIGDGCQIGDGSVVKHSVVGSGSVLFNDLTLGFAVCYPETFLIHGPYHLSIFGRSSAMFATILDDFRLDGKPIRIMKDGKLTPYPFPFLGSFIGHRTRVAGGSIIGPGRSIPNDLLIFPPPDGVLNRIPDGLPRGVPLFIQDGGLEEAPGLPSTLHDVGCANGRGGPGPRLLTKQ